jgi:hypothetical protein
LQLLKDTINKVVRSAQPCAHDDGLLDPNLVLLSEEANINQIIEDLAGGSIAMSCEREAHAMAQTRTCSPSVCECDA